MPLEVATVLPSWPGKNSSVVSQPLLHATQREQASGKDSSYTLLQLVGAEITRLGILALPDQAGVGHMYMYVLCKQLQQCDSS